MSTLVHSSELLTVEEYLAGELRADSKHEYLGGVIYAMAGASEEHNVIAANLIGLLHSQLRGKSCQPFGSDMKVRLRTFGDTYFYYPDAMVACDPSDSGHPWRERPSILFEILSEETRRIDEREKRFAYFQILSLQAYVRVEQGAPEIVVERRGTGEWEYQKLSGLEAVLELPGLVIPLAALYERISF